LNRRRHSALGKERELDSRLVLLPLSILFLAGCTPAPAIESPPPQQSAAGSLDALSCSGAGGAMERVGRLQTLQCVIAYADAGKSCSSGADCAGDCRAQPGLDARPGQQVAGVCQATSDQFGCSTRIEDGRAQSTICID
jgi:hypothetical protein